MRVAVGVGSANLFGPVNRFKTVIVTAVDGRGSPFQLEASDYLLVLFNTRSIT